MVWSVQVWLIAVLAAVACGPIDGPTPVKTPAQGYPPPSEPPPPDDRPATATDRPATATSTVQAGPVRVSIEKEILSESRVIGGVENEDGSANVSVNTAITLKLRFDSIQAASFPALALRARAADGSLVVLDLAGITIAGNGRAWSGEVAANTPIEVWVRGKPHPDLRLGDSYSLLARLQDAAGSVYWVESSTMVFSSRTHAAP